MPAIITDKTRIFNAQQAFEALSEADATNLFIFLGKVSAWADDNDPPTPENTSQTERLAWEDMIGGEIVSPANISHVIRRVDWTTGTVYPRFSDKDPDLVLKDFYVITDDYNVYKCIDNNAGAQSLVKPTGTGTAIITLGDGYKWKYMYTVDTSDALKFMTPNWVPVKELDADDGSNQWVVQQTAIDGGLHAIDVVSGGAGYTSAPTVIIEGDGTGAVATATLNGNVLESIDVVNPGSGYTEATIILQGGSPTTAGAAEAIISPPGGHGSNALRELLGIYLMVNVELEESEGGKLPITNDFRKIGLLADPIDRTTGLPATLTNFDQTTRLNINAGYTGTFNPDELITGNVSGATAQVVKFDATNDIIHINEITGTFQAGEGVTTSSGAATIDTITDPDLDARTGDLLFIEYRTPISRADDQTEQIRIIFEY